MWASGEARRGDKESARTPSYLLAHAHIGGSVELDSNIDC